MSRLIITTAVSIYYLFSTTNIFRFLGRARSWPHPIFCRDTKMLCPNFLCRDTKMLCPELSVPIYKLGQFLSLRHSRQTNLSTAQAAITVRVFSKILLVIAFCVIKLRSINNLSGNLAITCRRQSLLVSIARSFS